MNSVLIPVGAGVAVGGAYYALAQDSKKGQAAAVLGIVTALAVVALRSHPWIFLGAAVAATVYQYMQDPTDFGSGNIVLGAGAGGLAIIVGSVAWAAIQSANSHLRS